LQELEKLHSFEEKLQARVAQDAAERGVPALPLSELPAKADLDSTHALSAAEAKWCIEKATAKAAELAKDPAVSDPYNTSQFKELLRQSVAQHGLAESDADAIWKEGSKSLGL